MDTMDKIDTTSNFHHNWTPSCFNVIGCEYSTDIDIIIPVPSIQVIQDYKNKKFKLEISSIKNDLINLGYDLESREIDINLVYLDPCKSNIICGLLGEPKLTQNIIYNTYSLHHQLYPPIVSNTVQINLNDLTRLFSKIILDWMEKLLGKIRYNELRPTKSKVYTDLISRLDFSLQILKEINFTNIFNTNKDITKSLGMKLSQLALLYLGELEYTKKDISFGINKILPIEYENILFILTRGKMGKINDLDKIQQIFSILIDQYQNIIQDIKLSYEMYKVPINVDEYLLNSTDFVVNQFIKSPERPTQQLAEYIDTLYQSTQSLNQIFQIKSFGINTLPEQIIPHICIEDQRSPEWLDLLKFYKCGNSINNAIPYVDCETNFNLIRGCIGEKLLVDLIDWNKLIESDSVSKCICGLIVETKGLCSSIGISPDLLLITKMNQIIPVEIKTIVSDPDIINRKFLREIKLASKQLETSINLIEQIIGIKTYGLIVFCFIHNNQIHVKYKKYSI